MFASLFLLFETRKIVYSIAVHCIAVIGQSGHRGIYQIYMYIFHEPYFQNLLKVIGVLSCDFQLKFVPPRPLIDRSLGLLMATSKAEPANLTAVTVELIPTENFAIGFYILIIG